MSKSIAFVNSSKSWGGGEKWHLENAEALLKRDFQVKIICFPDSELHKKANKINIPTITIPVNNLSFLNPLKLLIARNILSYFDSAILNLPSDLKLFGFANINNNCKLIYRRGSAIPIKNNKINKYLLNKKVNKIIANSLATKNTILENNILDNPDKITIIYNGLKINNNTKDKNIEEKLIIGNLGRLVEQKNQLQLIEIAKILKDKHLNFELRIGGKGELSKALESKINELELTNHVKMLGEIKDLDEFYNSIDIFALTSKWEGFGYVIAESFTYKKPVIGFDVSSNPELIKNKHNGFLIPPYESEKFAEKIIYLSQNPDLIKKMGDSARNFVSNERNFDKSLEKLIEMI